MKSDLLKQVINRRQFATGLSAAVLSGSWVLRAKAAGVRRIVFVHGRANQGLDPVRLKERWTASLQQGAKAAGVVMPRDIHISFPYYGNTLAKFAKEFDVPLTSDIKTKGGQLQDEFLRFQAEVADNIRKKAGVSDAQINQEYGTNPKPKGPLNWEWVQAIIRALDKHANGMSQKALELFTRDVFLYVTRSGVRDEIDKIVAKELTEEPTLLIGHSLGTVVTYNVLKSDPRRLNVPLFVTLGSPLGIRSIRNYLRPIKSPHPVNKWFNAFDQKDVVALHSLNKDNFPVTPPIENFDTVNNKTGNHHGIDGYLADPTVASRIVNLLVS